MPRQKTPPETVAIKNNRKDIQELKYNNKHPDPSHLPVSTPLAILLGHTF